tara:strand:+ start:680 stop:1159 length:480 start_codon:yes stop_codon:yes gene_type:complete
MQLRDNKQKEMLLIYSNHDIKNTHINNRESKVNMHIHKQAYRLQMLRKKHYLTTRDLAKKLGVSNGIISRWCTGSAYPSRKHVRTICEYFNVEPAWFIYGIDDKPAENDMKFVYGNLNVDNKERVIEIAKALLKTQDFNQKDLEKGRGVRDEAKNSKTT